MDMEWGFVNQTRRDVENGVYSEPNDMIEPIYTLIRVAVPAFNLLIVREAKGRSYRETYKVALSVVREAIFNVRDLYRQHFTTGGYYGAPRYVFETLFSAAEAMPCDVHTHDEFEVHVYRVYRAVHELMTYYYNEHEHRIYDEDAGGYIWDEDGFQWFHKYWDSPANMYIIDGFRAATPQNVPRETIYLKLVHYEPTEKQRLNALYGKEIMNVEAKE